MITTPMNPELASGPAKLVKIGWVDAISNLEEWQTEEEALEWAASDNWMIHQVGWILAETETYILLAGWFNETSGGRAAGYSGLLKIPRGWVRYCEEIL